MPDGCLEGAEACLRDAWMMQTRSNGFLGEFLVLRGFVPPACTLQVANGTHASVHWTHGYVYANAAADSLNATDSLPAVKACSVCIGNANYTADDP